MTTDASSTMTESNPEPGQEGTEPASPRADNREGQLRTADLVRRAEESTTTPDAMDREQDPHEADPPLVTDSDSYLSRWQAIQVAFVDEPKGAVQDADSLVAEVMQRLAESFATERDRLEKEWSGGQETGTEELRLALQRYRSFFNRLLTT